MVAAAGAQQQQPRQSAMGVLGNSLAMGFGVGLMFAVVRLIF
jgi:predicted lipid-binding transport protein (Tim44 family)